MIDDKLKEVLIQAGTAAAMSALPHSFQTENGFTVPTGPLKKAILDIAVQGFEALLTELEVQNVEVVGGENTEVVVTLRD